MNGRLLFPILLGLLLTTSLAILVPMHSDDYANALNTLSWDIVRHKYLAWSGRLVADILSPILASLPHGIKAALTGAVLTVLIYTTSTLVPRTAQEERFTPAIFCLLFLSYWIFNPALGEGTFWIIGSANYMWPLLFCAFFIKYTLHFVTTRDNRHFVLACIFALPAGCSNEAASVGTVSFIALATLLNWKDLEIRKRMLTLFLVCGAGAALMILAPGNQVRLSQTEWAHTPLPEKLRKHFFSRLPKILRFFQCW